MHNSKTTLTAQNLSYRFAKNIVLEKVSIKVSSSEIFGLLGPNGAGKTTCIQLLAGLLTAPENAEIILHGENISRKTMQKRALKGLIYLPQETSVFRRLTVSQNLELVLEERKYKKGKIPTIVDSTLKQFDLFELKNSICDTLSGGEKRRVEIARALVLDPKVILLDEPFAGIDPLGIKKIQAILKKLAQNGIAILVSDHNILETLRICDKAMIINHGNMLCCGTPNEISNNELAKNKYLGDDFKLDRQ